MTNPRRPRGRPKGSTNKKAAAGKAKKQHQQHHLSPSVQAQERLVDFLDLAVVPREAAKKATSRLNGSTPSRDATAAAAAAPSSNGKKKGRGRPRSILPSPVNKADGGGGGSSSSSSSSKKRKAREADESSEETAAAGSNKSHKKTPKKKHGPSPSRSGTGSYPKRIRNAPDVFKAGPSTKPMSPSKPTTTTPASGKYTGKKKGAAAAVAVPKSKAKSPVAKKKPAKPAPPPPPPPPPPPYRFDYKGWPAIGGRELLAAGMFLYVSAPMMKFGRGFEVKMQALEEALSSDRPEENELLSLVHSRLLCTGRELKALKPGEMKYPYSWWTERLQKKLADWYRRRAVLRELIFEAERSDDEGDIVSVGAGGSAAGRKGQKKKAVATKGLGEAGGGGGGTGGGPTAASGGLQQQAATVGAAGGGGEVGGGLPKGRSVDAMDVEGAVGAVEGTEAGAALGSETEVEANGSGVGMRGDDDGAAADFDGRKQQDAGGGVEETKGGEESSSRAVAKTKAAGAGGVRGGGSKPKEEPAEISKRVSATQCKVCNTRGTVTDMVRCIYEGCGNKYHLRCLIPVVDEVPKGQWYCPDCRAKKRVFGCNGCMQNDRPTQILQCDGPMCGLEYHYGCLDPPLDKVPTTKWWYCPDCVRTDNQVGCRVCKADVDYDQLLKCDGPGCELEWHTYCLKPPVKTVPKGDFFCPYCKAKQKVEFEKKRQQDIARANEKRRRREARKARATDYSDDDQPAYGWRGVAGLRGALLAQYEDLEPDSLRLELHRINTLLRNIEEAREASDALAAAAAASAAPTASSTTGPAAAEDAAESEPTDSPADDGTEPDVGSPPVEEGGSGADGAGDRAGSPVVGEMAKVGEPAAAAVDGVPSEKTSSPGAGGPAAENKVDGATAGTGAGVGASAAASGGGDNGDASAESGDGKGASDGQGTGCAGSSGGDNGDAAAEICDGQAAGDVPKETDPVAAFWAALAAAAPAEPAPMDDGSGDGGGADEEEQEEEEEVDGAWGGAGDSPLANDKSYASLSVPLRAAILSAICEDYMEDDGFRVRIIDEVYPDWLRATPFGYDSCGRLYYRFIHFRKEMRVYRTVEGDSPIPPVDKFATEMTGCGTLEAAAEAAADRKPSRLHGGSELELVADSLEGMERLLAALSKSKSKSKRDDAALHTNLAQEVEEMGTWVRERMEKEEKRRLAEEAREKRQLALEAQPRRRSGRLIRAEAGWAVASLKEKEEEEEEEEEEGEEETREEGADQAPAESPPGHGASDNPPQDDEVGLCGTAAGGGNGDDVHTAPAGPGEGTSAPAMMADGSSALLPMDTGEEEEEGAEEGAGGGVQAVPEVNAEMIPAEEEEKEEEEKGEDEGIGPGGAAGNAPGEIPAPSTVETAAPALGKHLRTDDPSPTEEDGAEDVAAVSAAGADGGGSGRGEPNGGADGGAEGGAGCGDDPASKRRRGGDGGVAISVGEEQTTAAAVAAAAAAGASSANGGAVKHEAGGGTSGAPLCVNDGVSRPGGGDDVESSSARGDASAAAAAGDALPNGSSTSPNDGGCGTSGPAGKEPRALPQQPTASAVCEVDTAGADQRSTTRETTWEKPPAAASSGVEVGAGSGPLSPPEERRRRPEAGAVSSPVETPPLNGMTFSGALDIMALAASSRPRAATPSSSRSPSQDRSSGGGGGGGAGDDGSPASGGNGSFGPLHGKTIPAAGLGTALDIMASAVDARAPGALLSNGGRNGGDGAEGGQEGRSPAGAR